MERICQHNFTNPGAVLFQGSDNFILVKFPCSLCNFLYTLLFFFALGQCHFQVVLLWWQQVLLCLQNVCFTSSLLCAPLRDAPSGMPTEETQFSPVAQLCLTLCDPMDCSPPDSSVCGISQARTLERFAISSSSRGIFLIQESNPGLLHCRQILYRLSLLLVTKNLGLVPSLVPQFLHCSNHIVGTSGSLWFLPALPIL